METEKSSQALMPPNIGVRTDRGSRSVQELVVESLVGGEGEMTSAPLTVR